MSSIKISEIDADWLADNVDKKTFLKAVGILMGKKRSKKSGDGSSVASREVSDAMREHHERTSNIAALLRHFKGLVEEGEREFDMNEYPKGAHLRVVSFLKDAGTIDEVIEGAEFKEGKDGAVKVVEASDECITALEEALNHLVENPDWKPESKKPAKKAAPKKSKKALDLSDDESEDEAPKPKAKAAAKPAKEEKPKKAAAKALDLSDSESEDEKPKAKGKTSPKAAAPAAPKAKPLDLSDSEDEAPKPKAKPAAKPVEAKPKAAEAKPKKAAESESEDEKPKPKAKAAPKTVKKAGGAAAAGGAVRLDDMVKVSVDGRDLLWDQDGDKSLYDAEGTRVGRTEDGTTCETE
jgi:hypothetical protein